MKKEINNIIDYLYIPEERHYKSILPRGDATVKEEKLSDATAVISKADSSKVIQYWSTVLVNLIVARIIDWMNSWMYSMNKWVSEWMIQWTNDSVNENINSQTNNELYILGLKQQREKGQILKGS